MSDITCPDLTEYLLQGILDNGYLKKLYHELLQNYRAKLYSSPIPYPEINVPDIIQFASLLSLSHGMTDSKKHLKLSQELVSLLLCLYPDREDVRQAIGEILTDLGNFPGADIASKHFRSVDPMQRIYDLMNSDYFAIPHEAGKVFSKEQKVVYDHLFQTDFSYSGPTSMGKTFLIQVYIRDQIIKGKNENYALLVPSKALINEVSSKVTESLGELLQSEDYRVVTSVNSVYLEQKHHFVFVLTPERFLYLLIQRPDVSVDFLFVDEAHKISVCQGRSGFYYQCLSLLRTRNPKARIVYASPYISNPELFLPLSGKNSHENMKDSLRITESPVSQIILLVDLVQKVIKPFDDINGVFLDPSPLSDGTATLIPLIEKVARFDTGNPEQTLVYCCSREKTITYAEELCSHLPEKHDPDLDDFSREIFENISEEYCLGEFIKKGVAFHVGYLPASIRMTMERLFKERKINAIFCTSTLIEGVNLPADHLFVTSRKTWKRNMTPIEFRNLIGRVGRISYSLSGNVFFIVEGKKKNEEKDYSKLVMEELKPERLSVDELNPMVPHVLINNLLHGKASLSIRDFDGLVKSEEEYDLCRKLSTILLNDICKSRESVVLQSFRKYGLTAEKEDRIRSLFYGDKAKKTEDINFSLDQEQSLEVAVKERTVAYPKPKAFIGGNPRFDFNDTLEFLNRMASVFNWERYESKLLRGNKLRFYAQLILRWIGGSGLNLMVRDELEYYQENDKELFVDGVKVHFDSENKLHRNLVISNLLQEIQKNLLFSIANYFLKLSTEYKKQYGDDSLVGNDWYEFVEFGSTNVVPIYLQRSGFTREAALFLWKERRIYLQVDSVHTKILTTVFHSRNLAVVQECEDVRRNNPYLFLKCDNGMHS